MEAQELVGYYTLRGFLDDPAPVSDFKKIKLFEAELYLLVQNDGSITGTIFSPAEYGALVKKLLLNVTGTVKNWYSPVTLELSSRQGQSTEVSDIQYQFSCSVNQTWEKGVGQRLTLTGTVLSMRDQDFDGHVIKAGATASLVAVKRDFIEPKDIQGVAIIPSALTMLAARSHRLKHAVWHTIRGVWNDLDEVSKSKIRDLGWGLNRPPFTKEGTLDLNNGAGEDFLFMHRKMISMVRETYSAQNLPPIESWKIIPGPNAQQFSYLEDTTTSTPGKKIYRLSIADSGFMVPPASASDPEPLKFLKSPSFFRSVMSQLEDQFQRPAFLSLITLGALGNLLEFVIHNQMHMRWSSISTDPKTGEPAMRDDFDFDTKWDDPKYDYLGEFYSSHVNPVFWRLHGWIDDRIEDWFNAHEAAKPGEVERYDYQEISWFKPGKWVVVQKPWYWPEHQHHHGAHDQKEIDTMLKVMEIIKSAFQNQRAKAKPSSQDQGFGITSFMNAISKHT
jgi:hypothetical protein